MFLRIQQFNEFNILKNKINFYKFNQVFDEFGPFVNSNFGEFTCLNFEPKKAPYRYRVRRSVERVLDCTQLRRFDFKRRTESCLMCRYFKKQDFLCVLPTGFGKSLILQLIPFVVDRLAKVSHSCVLVVSPLNTIISDQIEKLKERGVGVRVLKEGDHFVNPSIDDKFVYGHAQAFVGNESVRTLLRLSFRDRVKAVVIDEAHFIVQW